MIAKNVPAIGVIHAMQATQLRYSHNLAWKRRPEKDGNRVKFTITVEDTSGPGGRIAPDGRRIKAACWHAHGHLFDAILAAYPDAEITTQFGKITREGGNWGDRNIGSMVAPFMYSEGCRCEAAPYVDRHGWVVAS